MRPSRLPNLSASDDGQQIVDALNKRLGTDLRPSDYGRWQRGDESRRSKEFGDACEKYVGSSIWKTAAKISSMIISIKHLF